MNTKSASWNNARRNPLRNGEICIHVVTALIAVALWCLHAAAMDWPQYRGPNHDGVSPETIRLNWNEVPPRVVWQVSLGPGLSSFSIGGGQVFTMVRRLLAGQETEYCVALNPNTGAENWGTPIGLASYPNGGVGDGSDDGPRSTPSIDGNRAYAFGSYQVLACLDAESGEISWKHDLRTEYASNIIPWQSAASPLVEGDLVLVNSNGRTGERILAFNKFTGQEVWKSQNDVMTQSSPISATIQGIRQCIFFTQTGLVSMEPQTGNVLWRYAISYNGTSVAASPIVFGDLVYASRAYPVRAGAVVARISKSGETLTSATQWTKGNQLMNHWCTPVQVGGYLYGMFGQDSLTFKCIDFATGAEKWSVGGFGYGAAISVGGKILASSESGDLVLVEPTPAKYTELGRFNALDGRCWNVAAVSNGRIYFRSSIEGVALDVAVAAPPALRLAATRPAADAIHIEFSSSDNSPIDTARASNISVSYTTDPLGPTAVWYPIDPPPVLSNGKLLVDDRVDFTTPQRIYRANDR